MARIIGIDLGTTNSCLAVLDGDEAVVIPNKEGQPTTPSVVYLDDNGKVIVGALAKRQAAMHPLRTFFGIKRLIGQRFDSPAVQALRRVLPYKLIAASNGDAAAEVDGRALSPQEISSHILEYLKDCAEQYLGERVTDAVITVPAYFNDGQRQATRDAARIAGLNARRILNEPTAAALAYGAGKDLSGVTWAVFDLGGGTFDVSVVNCEKGIFEVLATAGDTHLGGVDFDTVVLSEIVARFLHETGADISQDPVCLHRVREEVETARCALSSCDETRLSIPYLTASPKGPLHLNRSLDRGSLERLVGKLLARLQPPIRDALSEAKLDAASVDGVLMVGGMTRTPAVRDVVGRIFGKPPVAKLNPDQIVAQGAAWYGGSLGGQIDDVLLLDVTPQSLGVAALNGKFSRVIPRNRTVPTEERKLFATTERDQDFVYVDVYQGDADHVAENILLGRLVLDELPAGPAGSVRIEVGFQIDASGIVNVTARHADTGREARMTMKARAGLSPTEVEQMATQRQRRRSLD